MVEKVIAEEEVWRALEEVVDPEIPVVSLVGMGIVRDVSLDADEVIVTLTPTFSGCPALEVMGGNVKQRLRRLGLENVKVRFSHDPPWTSDWITPEAREKLKAVGLAPPKRHGGNVGVVLMDPVACPYCDSENTSLRNSFGTTPCRMIYYCNHCNQPFEQFKPL